MNHHYLLYQNVLQIKNLTYLFLPSIFKAEQVCLEWHFFSVRTWGSHLCREVKCHFGFIPLGVSIVLLIVAVSCFCNLKMWNWGFQRRYPYSNKIGRCQGTPALPTATSLMARCRLTLWQMWPTHYDSFVSTSYFNNSEPFNPYECFRDPTCSDSLSSHNSDKGLATLGPRRQYYLQLFLLVALSKIHWIFP